MKKVLAIALALIMLFSFAACAQSNPNGGNETPNNAQINAVDISKYPADINEWSGQNFIDYFKEAGVFVDEGDKETWLQDHAMYWPGTPVNECAGFWDDAGSIFVMLFILKEDLADSTPEAYADMLNGIKENKKIDLEMQAMPIDHLLGNVAFCTSLTTDEDTYNAMEAAYNQLVSDLGVTPEF
ncbi:MAG: hypothetical protein J1E05_05960 [Eubacterium sp.]|nr:hypothetical protein [Eubacterium sp.]